MRSRSYGALARRLQRRGRNLQKRQRRTRRNGCRGFHSRRFQQRLRNGNEFQSSEILPHSSWSGGRRQRGLPCKDFRRALLLCRKNRRPRPKRKYRKEELKTTSNHNRHTLCPDTRRDFFCAFSPSFRTFKTLAIWSHNLNETQTIFRVAKCHI